MSATITYVALVSVGLNVLLALRLASVSAEADYWRRHLVAARRAGTLMWAEVQAFRQHAKEPAQ